MQTVLVTGCAGFIGAHLSRALLREEDIRVVGVDNLNNYYDPGLKKQRLDFVRKAGATSATGEFEFHAGDIADAEFVTRLFTENNFTTVVNLAAQAGVRYSLENPRSYVESNLVGFFNILDAARLHGTAHLIYASSSSVYGSSSHTPYTETQQTDTPVSLYAATKKSNELMAHTYSHLFGLPTTGLRFFTVYGPYGRPDMAYFSFAERLRAGKPIQLFNHGDMLRDFTYIDDVVSALVRIIRTPPAEAGPDAVGGTATTGSAAAGAASASSIYNIGNSNPVRLEEFVDILESCLLREGIITGPAVREYLPMQPGDVYQTYADTTHLERDYGFRPATPLAEGLARFAKWYRVYLEGQR